MRHRSLAATAVILASACVAFLFPASSDGAIRQYSGTPSSSMRPTEIAASSETSARASLVPSAVALTPCDGRPERLCGEIEVPLDRANPAGAQIPIHFEVYPHTGPEPADEAIFVTEGGPGGAITQNPFFGDFLRGLFDPLLEHRDLVLIDQRGVGLSDAIDCAPLQGDPDDIYAAVAECGAQLGAASSLYGSGDVALDIEAVRQALGIETLNLYGGSYSAVDFQAYAARFPDRLRSIVLDSPASPVVYDPFFALNAHAIERAIELICKRSANCSADVRDADDEVEWLARRLKRHPVHGTGYDADGIPHTISVTEGSLASQILWSESGGFLSIGEIAAAARALRHGDPVPLLRLGAENDGSIFAVEEDATSFSGGDNWARYCTDFRFPWRKGAPIEQRRAQEADAVEDLDEDEFEPFSIDGWLAPPPIGGSPDPCIVWPAPRGPVEPAIPSGARFPKVPALVLSGDLDLDTPTTVAKRVAGLFPRSRFFELANSGHHTALSFRFECADAIVVQFLDQLSPGDTSCARSNEFVIPAIGRFPEEAEDARPAGTSSKGKHRGKHRSNKTDRRVAAVAAVAATTVIDAFKRSFIQSGPDGVGLRGGTFSISFSDTAATVEFTGARFAEDVAVSGTAIHTFESDIFDINVTVDGPGGADGTLNITGQSFFSPGATTWQIRGVLGGRTVDLRVPVT